MKSNVKKTVLVAMMAAVAYLLAFIVRIPVGFLSFEPKDVIIVIGGFLMGPMTALITSTVVALLEMVTFSTTGPIGCIMNLLSSACFACTAALIYKKRRYLKGAILGLLAGSVTMVLTMLLWNYLITPLYITGTTRSWKLWATVAASPAQSASSVFWASSARRFRSCSSRAEMRL